MSLFKRAFARGVNDELIRLGYARYPSKTAGNVSPEEQQMLSNVVFQLRALYLQRQ